MKQNEVKSVIIFANFHEKFMQEVAQSLGHRLNAQIFHCCFWDRNTEFQFDVLTNYFDLSNYQNNKTFSLIAQDTDFSEINSSYFSAFYGEFRQLLERYALNRFSEEIVLGYYNLLVAYWKKKLSAFKPLSTAVIFDSTPHQPWDYTLYIVAKKLGIDTLIIKRTKLPTTLLLSSSIKNEQFIEVRKNEISTNEYYSNSTVYWNQYLDSRDNILKEFVRSLTRVGKLFRKFSVNFASNAYKKHYFGLNRFSYLSVTLKLIFSQLRSVVFLWRYWGTDFLRPESELLNKIKSEDIYVALHYQPERSTAPEAGALADQLTALRILSQKVPKGSKIYVKEHPQQLLIFDLNLRKLAFRGIGFYLALVAIPNVTLVPKKIRASEIINRVGLVCSATGSVLWEALMIGKPVITFAPTWLTGHDSVFDLSSNLNSISEAFNSMVKPKEAIKEETIQFLSKLSKCLVLAPHSDSQAAQNGKQRLEQVESLVLAFEFALRKIKV